MIVCNQVRRLRRFKGNFSGMSKYNNCAVITSLLIAEADKFKFEIARLAFGS